MEIRVVVAAVVVLGAIVAATLPSEIGAQSPCQNALASLSPCYSYTDGNDSTPCPLCCSRFQNVVNAQPECLCEVLNEQGLNQTRAMALPGTCNVQTPPASYCYTPPPSSGYSTKLSNSLLLSLLAVASYAGILTII